MTQKKSPQPTEDTHDFSEDDVLLPSKTQLKKQMLELQNLGREIAELPDKQRNKIPLNDALVEGINTYRRIKSREGKRRQMQYIGKLMRSIDTNAIYEAMREIHNGEQKTNQQLHELETLRDQFIAKGDAMLPYLLERFPSLDRQHLRQLLREAKKEINANKPPTNQRKIFQYFKELYRLTE